MRFRAGALPGVPSLTGSPPGHHPALRAATSADTPRTRAGGPSAEVANSQPYLLEPL